MVDVPIGPVDIREGTEEDREAIVAFALALTEDPVASRDKWLRLMNNDKIYPLVAVYKQNIVGKVQARILDNVGWLEKARVRHDFRRVGIASTLVDAAMDWLIEQGVTEIKTMIDSDNMAGRIIVERHHFTPQFLTINPSADITEDDANPQLTADVAPVLDETLYSHFYNKIALFNGNIMINGQYAPLSKTMFTQLIKERRIYTDYNQKIMIVLSSHQLPSEYHGFVVAGSIQEYEKAGRALRGFAGRELTTLAISYALASRDAVIGLARAEFGWNQPHSLIIYRRESWQEK